MDEPDIIILDTKINNEPRCSFNTNEVRETSTRNNAKRIEINPVNETEVWNSDGNKGYGIIDDILGIGGKSTQDISNAFEEGSAKKIKDPDSEVRKSKLTRDSFTAKLRLALEKSEFPSVDAKMKGQRIIYMKMPSIKNVDLDSMELEASLNSHSCSPQTVKIVKGIQGKITSRKRYSSDRVEGVAKKMKTSMNSQTINEDSLIATDQLYEINTVSVNVSLSSKTMIKSNDFPQASLHRGVVNEVSSSKDSILICQPASSTVDCSLLKYFQLITEIKDEELTECNDYLSKFCHKNDSSAIFFENPERKLIKQSKAPISSVDGLGISESNEKLQKISTKLVKEDEHIPKSANKDSQISSQTPTEGDVIREISLCEKSYLKERNVDGQNKSFTSEKFEDEIKENISSPISRNQPNVQNDKLDFLQQGRNTVNKGNKMDTVKEFALNVSDSDPKQSSRIVETFTGVERDIEGTESTDTQGAQKKSIEISGSSSQSRLLNTNLAISVTSGNKRIVRACEPNILHIVPLLSSTPKSQTQRHEFSSGEASHSVQLSSISSTLFAFMQKEKSQTSEITSVQIEKNMSHPLETFKPEDNGQNLRAPTHMELPKWVPSEVASMEASNNIFFRERKGNRKYLAECLYKNVGKTFITNDDLPFLILEWNATWLSTQDETKMCAPICDMYHHVKYRYADELDYYNTFIPLHLLSIWLRISDSWKKNTETFDCVFVTETDMRNAVKITCYTALNPDRGRSWFRSEDILLCRALKPGGVVKELFGRICNVTYTDYKTDDVDCRISSRLKKVTFQFLCAEALGIPNLITVKIQILGNIRTALLQNDALQYLNDAMKDLILDPENHRSSMNFISLYPRHHEAFPKCKKDMIDSIMSSDVHVTVVDTLVQWDIMFVTLLLAVALIKSNRSVLIGVRDVDTLIELASALKHYNLILAVKQTEAWLPDELRRFTLDERCRLLNRKVFFKCHVTLTLLSCIYMGDAVVEQQLTCILPEAHLCTETESALLLYYNVKHLALIGRNERNPNLHSVLKSFGYDISLFNRLYKAKVMP